MKMKLSYKYGFLGLGLGGTSIAAACADLTDGHEKFPYSSLLINTNQQDLDKVQTINPQSTKKIIGDGKGAGRDIHVGEQLFISNKEEILTLMKDRFLNSDFIWISAGLGGGTGTGAVIQAIGLCLTLNKPFGLILTLPRENERSTVNGNALVRLNKIYAAMDKLGPVIVVDNKKLFNEYTSTHPNSSLEEYLAYSNNYVAEAIHDKNIITSNFSVFGATNFDASELGKMLRTSGALHFARLELTTSDLNELDTLATMDNPKAKFAELLNEKIRDGVLSSGFDFTQTKRAAISVLAHENKASKLFTSIMSQQLENVLQDVAPNATESPVSFYTFNDSQLPDAAHANKVYFYVLLAGLDLPKDRVREMIELDKKSRIEPEAPKEDLFAGYTEVQQSNVVSTLTIDALFGPPEKEVEDKNQSLFKELGLV